jgi:hypothetical protein
METHALIPPVSQHILATLLIPGSILHDQKPHALGVLSWLPQKAVSMHVNIALADNIVELAFKSPNQFVAVPVSRFRKK